MLLEKAIFPALIDCDLYAHAGIGDRDFGLHVGRIASDHEIIG